MKIGIIGAGKVGTALGHVMKRKGLHVHAVSDVSRESLARAEEYLGKDCLYGLSNREVAETSDVIAVTTQDREVRNVAQEIFDSAIPVEGKLFFHTSGAHPSSILSPLDEKGAVLGSLHPLQTFPDIESAIRVLPETFVFIEGAAPALTTLRLLGETIGRTVVTIEASQKVLYHLSAVFVCNLLCALLYSAEGVMERIGIGLEPFYPIIDATLRNIEQKGPLLSLTGPVVRGDAGTITDHLSAMSGMDQQKGIYKALSLVALDMARKRSVLDEKTLKALETALQETGD